MSKAFTSEESADASVPGRVPERVRPGEERPISPAGHRALAAELARLRDEELPRARSAGLGGEADVQRIAHRLALVEATLASVRIVEPVRDGRVRFGCRVTLALADGGQRTVTLVGPDETSPREGRISVDAPLARALLGREVGETVELLRAGALEEATIAAIASPGDEPGLDAASP